MRYIITVRVAHAPSSGGGKYRRPVHIRVMDSTVSEWHSVRRIVPGMMGEWRNVDSRYTGPRSGYGIAMAHAHTLCDDLNAKSSVTANT